jgi:hypothetical protein
MDKEYVNRGRSASLWTGFFAAAGACAVSEDHPAGKPTLRNKMRQIRALIRGPTTDIYISLVRSAL